jgi:hypothetical protein
MLHRDLQDSAQLARGTAPSRSRLFKSCCFNAGIMSRARKQAVCGILQVPLQLVQDGRPTGRVRRSWAILASCSSSSS